MPLRPVKLSRAGCSLQFGRASAPTIPQRVQTIRRPRAATSSVAFDRMAHKRYGVLDCVLDEIRSTQSGETVASRKERVMQTYSDFFKTLHDETSPTGYLGRGTHYSVLRAVVFHDPMGEPLPEGQYADFAVIWDEDHDTRVMEPIEEIYRRGLLSSFVMFGEHKGVFTAILLNKIAYFAGKDLTENREMLVPRNGKILKVGARVASLETKIKAICQSLNDPWPSKIAALGSARKPIISDEDEKVSLYLTNLEMLWQLGTVAIQPRKPATLVSADNHRVVQLERPAVDADGNLPGWTTSPAEADRDAF
jgi:hypothetical protein